MTSDVALICVHCGQNAERHHHREGPGPVGKGSGGLGPHEHLPEIPLCRKAHNLVHANELQLSLDGDVATGRENGMVVFERGVEVRDEQGDLRFWSDEKLAQGWEEIEKIALMFYEQQCEVAVVFYNRYKAQPEWYQRVAEIISTEIGYAVHWREVYRRVRAGRFYKGRWELYRQLGATLAIAVAESRDPEIALEIASAAKFDDHKTSREAIREIRGQAEPEPKLCPHCGGAL